MCAIPSNFEVYRASLYVKSDVEHGMANWIRYREGPNNSLNRNQTMD